MKAIAVSIFISCSVILFSCNNNAGKEVVKDFDSVNQSLQKANNAISSSAGELYQQLEKKLAGTDKSGSLQQLQYHIQDFYGYMADLKQRFYRACGDSTGTALPVVAEDSIDLTNSFFQAKGPAEFLPVQLAEVQQAMLKHTADAAVIAKINKLTSYPGEERKTGFNKGWFYNVPPVAAVTMLNKFENDVRTLEAAVLKQLLVQ